MYWIDFPVLSFIFTSTNRLLKKSSPQYDHNVQCLLRPSVIIMDWDTIKCLADIIGLLTATHQEYVIYLFLSFSIFLVVFQFQSQRCCEGEGEGSGEGESDQATPFYSQ